MKAAEVIEALQRRWPSDEYVHVLEAPLDASRQGTKIDDLVISTWASRGYRRMAVEVKVSRSDLLKEVQRVEWRYRYTDDAPERPMRVASTKPKPAWWIGEVDEPSIERVVVPDVSKSQRWREYAHEFWIACPMKLAVQARAEHLLPDDWGLIGVNDDLSTLVLAKPKVNHSARDLTWGATIGLLRAAQDAGFGVKLAIERRAAEAAHKAVADEIESLWRERDELRRKIREMENAR